MGAATGLAIEAGDLDDADQAIGGRRRGRRTRPDEAVLGLGRGQRQIAVGHREVPADGRVDRLIELPQTLVVSFRQIEIHTRRAVLVHLHAGDKGAVEKLVDIGIEQMGVGVQLAHHLPEYGIDDGFDRAGRFRSVGEQDPGAAFRHFEAGDGRLAAAPADQAAIGKLPAAARKERRAGERHAPGSCRDGLGRQRQIIGMVVIERPVHGPQLLIEERSSLPGRESPVLARIVQACFRREASGVRRRRVRTAAA